MKEFLDDYEDDFYPKKEQEIQIPDFIKGENVIPTEEQEQFNAIVNNVPNNSVIENQNHLKQLEEVATNYSVEEWKRVLFYAPSDMMAEELKRRIVTYEEYIANQRSNINTLTSQKL